MKTPIQQLIKVIESRAPEEWPRGNRHAVAMQHGSMYVELYAPVNEDLQSPHVQDELYIVKAGAGIIVIGEESYEFEAGDVFFVPAHVEHRFTQFSGDFATWVIFWGEEGGESRP